MAGKVSSKVPYALGAVFTIRQLTPPGNKAATSDGKPIINPQEIEATQPISLAEQSRCPPRQLHITEAISVGETRNAQIVLCQITPAINHIGSERVVAKIWDPLYRRDLECETPQSAVKLALEDFSNETSAYERIAESPCLLPWRCTPHYYGSWSLECPNAPVSYAGPSTRRTRRGAEETPRFRTVYLVLLEHIQGCSVMSLASWRCGSDYYAKERCDEDYRMYVWARILEIQSWLDYIGIDHQDVATRNIMVDPAPTSPIWSEDNNKVPKKDLVKLQPTKLPRVVFIDFDVSALLPALQATQPRSPIVKHWSGKYDPIMDWLPKWWTGNLPARRKWLLREFANNASFGEVPPDKGPGHVYVFSKRDELLMDDWGFWPPQGR